MNGTLKEQTLLNTYHLTNATTDLNSGKGMSFHHFSFVALVSTLSPALCAAQTDFYEVGLQASPFLPTADECLAAIRTGTIVVRMSDTRFTVLVGDRAYTIEMTPTYLDCTGVQYSPRGQ